jgi:hypothetical protein
MAYDAGDDYGDLIQALKEEEHAANDYLESEVSAAQIDALRRYYGEKYGDEVEGRSQIVTREVFETIEWLRHDLLRIFVSGGRIADFEGNDPQSDQHAEDAADYVNYVFLQDNPGERLLDEFIFDGLLQRRGFMACDWKGAEYSAPQKASGLNTLQLQHLMNDPQTEILDAEAEQIAPDEAHPDGVAYSVTIRQRNKAAYAECFTIAPEDMRISARAVDLESARYVGHVMRMM